MMNFQVLTAASSLGATVTVPLICAGPTDGHCDSETSWLHQSIIPGMQSSAAVCRRLRLLLPDSLKFKLLNASHDSSFAAAAASASCCCSGFLLLLL
jgi:hypothetical protein